MMRAEACVVAVRLVSVTTPLTDTGMLVGRPGSWLEAVSTLAVIVPANTTIRVQSMV